MQGCQNATRVILFDPVHHLSLVSSPSILLHALPIFRCALYSINCPFSSPIRDHAENQKRSHRNGAGRSNCSARRHQRVQEAHPLLNPTQLRQLLSQLQLRQEEAIKSPQEKGPARQSASPTRRLRQPSRRRKQTAAGIPRALLNPHACGRRLTRLQPSSVDSYLLLVRLANSDSPNINRLLCVPANLSFAKFRAALQIAFGWADSHLHSFSVTQIAGQEDVTPTLSLPKGRIKLTAKVPEPCLRPPQGAPPAGSAHG